MGSCLPAIGQGGVDCGGLLINFGLRRVGGNDHVLAALAEEIENGIIEKEMCVGAQK
jgi:hypothetical protein